MLSGGPPEKEFTLSDSNYFIGQIVTGTVQLVVREPHKRDHDRLCDEAHRNAFPAECAIGPENTSTTADQITKTSDQWA